MTTTFGRKFSESVENDGEVFSLNIRNRYRGSAPLTKLRNNFEPNHPVERRDWRLEEKFLLKRSILEHHQLETLHSNSFSAWRDVNNENRRCSITWDINNKEAAEIMNEVGVNILKSDPYLADEHLMPKGFVNGQGEISELSINRLSQECETFEPESNSNLPSASNISYHVKYHSLGEDLVLHRRKRGSNPRGINYTTNISDEVILQIFRFLHKKDLSVCAMVCKRWKSLAYDETLWRKLDLKKKYLHSEMLGYIIDRKVKALRLCSAKVEDPVLSPSLDLDYLECKIEYLDLSLCSISSKGIEDVMGVSSQLKKLSLESCDINFNICRFIANNKNLEVLNLCMCTGLNANGLLSIATNCKKLRSLNISWTGICSYSFDLLTVHLTPAIQHLNIAGARETLKDAHITLLGDLCPNLKELDISDSLKLTSATIDVIVSKLILIENFHASHCYNIAPVKYLDLRQLPYLKELQVFGLFNEEALQALRQSLPQIEINKQIFSTIARPTAGVKDNKMWGIQLRKF